MPSVSEELESIRSEVEALKLSVRTLWTDVRTMTETAKEAVKDLTAESGKLLSGLAQEAQARSDAADLTNAELRRDLERKIRDVDAKGVALINREAQAKRTQEEADAAMKLAGESRERANAEIESAWEQVHVRSRMLDAQESDLAKREADIKEQIAAVERDRKTLHARLEALKEVA